MAMMTTCCCCLSTKNGTIAVGVISLVFGFCIAVTSCFALINAASFEGSLKNFYQDYKEKVDANLTVNRLATIDKIVDVNLLIDNLPIAVITSLVFYSLYTFASLFMTYGACSELRALLLPWIVFEFVPFAIQLAGIVIVFVYGKDDPTLSQGGIYIIAGLVQIIAFVVHVYWWMCPVAHYQNLKESTEVEPLVSSTHPLYPTSDKY
ncbi:UNVERIFIED_CONTAM: hypothetical protein RMT77_001872 [Armadillidium vulgare]